MRGIVSKPQGIEGARQLTATARRASSLLRRLASRAACCLALVSASGCYLVQAAGGQLEVMSRSRPIDAVLEDAEVPEPTREQLRLLSEAREFAAGQLGLPAGDSYRDYAELDRPYAVWNLVAVPEFSLAPRRWCFPVAGCVSYLGYFAESDAEAAARKFRHQGFDVAVGGVAAYSTLGRLPDPVYSTMLRWRESRLVGTVFHELAHQRLYVKNDSAFNEAFASVVEEEGVRRWFTERGDEPALTDYEARLEREAEFTELLRRSRARLAALYAEAGPAEETRVEKQREFGRLKFEYAQLRDRWNGYGGYDQWFARPLNNAHLAAVATYHDCVPGLRRELESTGSLPGFYRRAEELASLPRAERHARVCIGAGRPAGAVARPSAQRAEDPRPR
jgi:predicted aminopeptidase